MPAPYDYTVNIPQPPAQNFLQSLLGIQQLKGLQQQSQLAEQQAQFAQQMQPLQLQTEQARLGQIGQATATGAEALRQSKTIFDQEQALRKEAQAFNADVLTASKDPTALTRDRLQELSLRSITINPKAFEPLQKMLADHPRVGDVMASTASDVMLSVQAGKPAVALASVDKSLSAAENTLKDNPNDKDAAATLTLLKPVKGMLENEDHGAAAITAANFLYNTYPEKWDRASKALRAGADISKEAALTEEAQAKAAKARGESATGEVEIKDVFTKKLLKDSIDKAKEYSEKADTALSILDKIDSGEVSLPSGFIGNAVQYVRDKVPALANDITALKKDYIRLKNSEAIKNLPKGSASDKDVAFAKEGLMSENVNPTQFRNAVEAMARLNSIDSTYNEAQAAWVSRNGNIGDSKREISVLGTTVPKGTGFREWWKSTGGTLGVGQSSTQAPTKTDQITGTPALVPAGGTPADVDAILKQFGVKK